MRGNPNPNFRNPNGRPPATSERARTLRDIRKLARTESLDALIAIIGCYKRRDGKIDPTADPRSVHAAAREVIKIAYGEMPAYDPTMERPETVIDLEGMSLAERKKLLEMMDRVTTVVAESDADDDDGPVFNGDRFGDEPLTIEADAGAAVETPKKPSGGKYRPPAAVMAAIISPPVIKPGRPSKRIPVPKSGIVTPTRTRQKKEPKRKVSLFDEAF